jgi:hypothetical protein
MTNFIIKKLPYDLSSHAGLALISKYLKRININALAQLKKDGRDVVVEYILAVPAARYGDFAKDLSSLHEAHDSTQEWCGQTQLWPPAPTCMNLAGMEMRKVFVEFERIQRVP